VMRQEWGRGKLKITNYDKRTTKNEQR